MNQEDSYETDQSSEHWISRFEDECFSELETQQTGVDSRLQATEEQTAQQLWLGFQQTSTAIAQLYNTKDNSGDGYVLLVPFNKAAESLTKFYKDSINNARECLRLGVQSGRNNRTRDIAAWARKKRKNIRREELLAYLCGKSVPPHHRNRQNRSLERQFPRLSPHTNTDSFDSGEYQVRDAFSLQGLNGAMSNVSVGYNRCGTSASSTMTSQEYRLHDDRNRDREHRKRANSSSSMDVSMDSPSRKRGRFL